MKKFYVYGLAVFCTLLGLFFIQPTLFHGTSSASTPSKADIHAKLQHLSIPFVANQGQTDKKVKFYAATFGGTVFVTETGEIVYSLPKVDGARVVTGAIIKEKPGNAKTLVVTGQERAAATVNYFKGSNKARWKKNLPTYDVVSLGEVYTGVDLKLRAYGNNVEKLFYVRPQADPATIAMNVDGAERLKVNKQGELEVVTAQGPVVFTKPAAYQEINGKRIDVAVAYALHNSKLGTRNSELTYGFTVGSYDKTKELVIDPLLASTYLGGTDLEGSSLNTVFAMSIAVAPNGDIYVAGFTDSAGTFPTVFGPFQAVFGGVRDAFISRFDRGLTNLAASTYLGGSGTDAATSLSIDGAGNVYMTGYTNSPNFPTLTPFQAIRGGGIDAFVAKLSANLSNLSASTYLGGANDDHAYTVVVDSTGVYLAGDTASTNFPISAPLQAANGDVSGTTTDGFISKLSLDLAGLTSSTYFGGSSNDSVNAMVVRGANIYVTGDTASADLPLVNPVQNAIGGGIDAFIAKLGNTPGTGLLASTYLGGTGDEHAYALATNAGGAVFVAGDTSSDGLATAGVYRTTKGTGIDAFVAKMDGNLAGRTLTYLGGSGSDHGYSLAITGANVFVAGDTTSSDFPTVAGSYDTTSNGGSDTFIAKLNDTLTALSASTYLGGSGNDFANAITLDIFDNVYLTGFTVSADLPTFADSYQNQNVGFSDAFVSEFDANLSTAPAVPDTTPPSAPTNLTATAASDTQITLLWTASTDNVGVVGYDIYRNAAKIKTVTTTSYSDAGLTPGTTYTYTVKAFDAANNTSAASTPATATTLAAGTSDTTPPSAPTNLQAAATSDIRIGLTWTASTDNVGVSGYKVYRGDTEIATVSTTAYSDGGLTPSTTYAYTVKAVDGAGNVSAASDPATMTTLAPGTVPGDGGGGGGGGGGCFIATAAYGSYMADDVMVLRRFRDDYLLTSAAGQAFVNLYYTLSPPVANFIARHETLRTATRAALSPLVYSIKYPLAAMLMLLLVVMGGVVGASMRRRRIRG